VNTKKEGFNLKENLLAWHLGIYLTHPLNNLISK
jgi:hypothetical protein